MKEQTVTAVFNVKTSMSRKDLLESIGSRFDEVLDDMKSSHDVVNYSKINVGSFDAGHSPIDPRD